MLYVIAKLLNSKYKNEKLRLISLIIIGLGFLMFVFSISLFTYTKTLNTIVSKLGELSFIFWMPTSLVGTVMFLFSKKKTKNN